MSDNWTEVNNPVALFNALEDPDVHTVYLPPQSRFVLLQDLVVSQNVSVILDVGAVLLAGRAGVSITIQGGLEASPLPLFGVGLDVRIEGFQVPVVFPQWWVSPQTNSNADALERAFESIGRDGAVEVRFPPGEYVFDRSVFIPTGHRLVGPGATIIDARSDGGDEALWQVNLVLATSPAWIRIEGFSFRGGGKFTLRIEGPEVVSPFPLELLSDALIPLIPLRPLDLPRIPIAPPPRSTSILSVEVASCDFVGSRRAVDVVGSIEGQLVNLSCRNCAEPMMVSTFRGRLLVTNLIYRSDNKRSTAQFSAKNTARLEIEGGRFEGQVQVGVEDGGRVVMNGTDAVGVDIVAPDGDVELRDVTITGIDGAEGIASSNIPCRIASPSRVSFYNGSILAGSADEVAVQIDWGAVRMGQVELSGTRLVKLPGARASAIVNLDASPSMTNRLILSDVSVDGGFEVGLFQDGGVVEVEGGVFHSRCALHLRQSTDPKQMLRVRGLRFWPDPPSSTPMDVVPMETNSPNTPQPCYALLDDSRLPLSLVVEHHDVWLDVGHSFIEGLSDGPSAGIFGVSEPSADVTSVGGRVLFTDDFFHSPRLSGLVGDELRVMPESGVAWICTRSGSRSHALWRLLCP